MWGVVMIGMGFVENWTALVGLRVILGILEVCIAPTLLAATHTNLRLL